MTEERFGSDVDPIRANEREGVTTGDGHLLLAVLAHTWPVAVSFLFPSDVLAPTKVDGHFRGEADAVRRLGFEIALVDHDALVAGDIGEAIRRVREPTSPLLYRGWMVQPKAYRQLEAALAARDVTLTVSTDHFERCHHLPNWYSLAVDQTANSVWTASADLEDFSAALEQLGSGAAVIKDFSKSEKAYWDEAMFIPDVTDTDAARRVASRFIELRDDYFDGGFVIRRFENYEPGECRSWWVNGVCVLVTAHPDTPDTTPDIDPDDLPRLAETPSPFFTMDVARNVDSRELRIVELGDGQVSDRPVSTSADRFIEAISARLS